MTDPRWDVSEAVGLEVIEGHGLVTLKAHTEVETAFLANANEKLQRLADYGVSPEVLNHIPGVLSMEYLDDRYGGDELRWLWGACHLLEALRECGIKHGDLAPKNLRCRFGGPMAIDFQESVWIEDGIETKRPEDDGEILMRSGIEITGDQDRRFRRWLAIRPHLGTGGILDLGCSTGHFARLAEVDSQASWIAGYDQERQETWAGLTSDRLTFTGPYDILELPGRVAEHWLIKPESAFVLSTWPYLVQQTTLGRATDWLRELLQLCDQVFFEPQLFGDGPGASIHASDGLVARWLMEEIRCKFEPLVTVPVHGREAYRTVWRLTT